MKNVFKISLAFAVGLLTGCLGSSDPVTGSKALTDQVAGKYAREWQEDKGSYMAYGRDTIYLIQKDNNFEVNNHRWYNTINKDSSPTKNYRGEIQTGYTRIGGFPTFQGIFNKIDSTISNTQGGSFKVNVVTGKLYIVDNPRFTYTKVK